VLSKIFSTDLALVTSESTSSPPNAPPFSGASRH
jgi:hypothetical protein